MGGAGRGATAALLHPHLLRHLPVQEVHLHALEPPRARCCRREVSTEMKSSSVIGNVLGKQRDSGSCVSEREREGWMKDTNKDRMKAVEFL